MHNFCHISTSGFLKCGSGPRTDTKWEEFGGTHACGPVLARWTIVAMKCAPRVTSAVSRCRRSQEGMAPALQKNVSKRSTFWLPLRCAAEKWSTLNALTLEHRLHAPWCRFQLNGCFFFVFFPDLQMPQGTANAKTVTFRPQTEF